MSAETILSRVEGVRQRGQRQWSARCPAHSDRSPSLSVKELDDGRVLLHCFGGCEVDAVLHAVGLSFEDLFPPREMNASAMRRPRLITAAQALEVLDSESLLVMVCASDIAKGKALDEETRKRLFKAVGRIGVLREEVRA